MIKVNYKIVYKWLNLFATYSLGLVFYCSGILKSFYIEGFTDTLLVSDLIPYELIDLLAYLLVYTEITVGILILLNIYRYYAVVLSLILFIMFNAYIFLVIINDVSIACNCFGPLFNNKITIYTLLRNILLMVLSVYTLFIMKADNRNTNIKSGSLMIAMLLLFPVFIPNNQDVQINKNELQVGQSIDPIKFLSVDKKPINSELMEKNMNIIIIISLSDCPFCLTESIMWNKIYKAYKDKVNIMGIVYGDDIEKIKKFIKNKRIHFPIWHDKNEEFIKKYKISTPKRILVNNMYKVIQIERPSGSIKAQEMFLKSLNDYNSSK